MKKVVIIGAGILGKQLLHFLKQSKESVEVIGWLDDTLEPKAAIEGVKVLGPIQQAQKTDQDTEFVIAIGYNHLKYKLSLITAIKKLNRKLYSIIHPTAIIDPSAILKEGIILYPGCIIDMNTQIHSGVLLNNGVIISHNSVIKEASFIAPGVTICGNVNIGKGCFIGAGSTIKNDVQIADNVTLGSGSNVYKDIPKSGIYVQKSKIDCL